MDIEVKFAFQEDTLQALNELIYQQQTQLDQLAGAFRSLESRIRELSETIPMRDDTDEKPPHY